MARHGGDGRHGLDAERQGSRVGIASGKELQSGMDEREHGDFQIRAKWGGVVLHGLMIIHEVVEQKVTCASPEAPSHFAIAMPLFTTSDQTILVD